LAVIANFLFGNIALAKRFKINDKDVERIKFGLDVGKMFTSILIGKDELKNILNTTIKGTEASTDITYGLLVLSSLNEMDLMDLVISQRYKKEATKYFNSILDERLNLINYYKGIGFDLPRVCSGVITGPMSALTLNTFSITNKTIEIFIALNVLKKEKIYDGLWYYFDLRRNGESHKTAWNEAKIVMGWAAKPLFPFRSINKKLESNESKLGIQFAMLWDKWGPYTTPFVGVNKEVKEQIKNELGNVLLTAIENHRYNKKELSLLEKSKIALNNLREKISRLGKSFGEYLYKIIAKIKDLLHLGGAFVTLPETLPNKNVQEQGNIENKPNIEPEKPIKPEIKERKNKERRPTLEEIQEELDDISERVDIISEGTAKLTEQRIKPAENKETEKTDAKQSALEKEKKEKEKSERKEQPETEEKAKQELCSKIPGDYPLRNRVIINEIAWMGSKNSASDEWIELKNISKLPVNLAGWQILDNDKQIKIIFTDKDSIGANKFYLLERTDDNSVPQKTANFIYTGTLGNSYETLYLFDNECKLEDEVSANPYWPAGSNSSKKTMERKTDLTWQTSLSSGGTPKSENSLGYTEIKGAGGYTPSPPPVFPKIIISEIQIAGKDGNGKTFPKEDFVELYNPNENDLDLTNWYLQRKTKSASDFSPYIPKNLLSGKIIKSQEYFLIINASSSFSADTTTTYPLTEDNTLILKNPNGQVVDKIGWGKAQDFETSPAENPSPGQSIGRKWSTTSQNYIDTENNESDFEIQTPTPNSKNQTFLPEQNQPPTARFEFQPENPVINQEVIFDASSSSDPDGNILNYIWNFGDNNSTTTDSATTTHSYPTSSQFTVSLTVLDNQGASSSPATSSLLVISSATTSPASTSSSQATSSPSRATPLSVVINEIAWMGTKANSADEWIELYNNTTSSINLINWQIKKGGQDFIIISTSTSATNTIPAKGFYLLERTDDNTIQDISADIIYKGSLNNNGEKLELYNPQGDLIDLVDCSLGWFAGSSTPSYISMERIKSNASGTDPQNWASNNLIVRNGKDNNDNNISGTPKAKNSVSYSSTTISSLPFNEFNEITLTYLGSPYIIQNPIIVLQGRTLNIEPGVSLRFVPSHTLNQGAYLEIDGRMIAEGKENKEIIFTSATDYHWPGIVFKGNLPETEITSRLDYVRIEKARSWETGLLSAVKVENKAILIKNSLLDAASSSLLGLYLINSSSTIENVAFNNFQGECQTSGKCPTAIYINGGSPKIKNSSFSKNYYGIVVNTVDTCFINPDFEISSNTFTKNHIPIYVVNQGFPCFKGNQVISPEADNSNNIFDGILFSGVSISQNTVWQSDLPIMTEKGFSIEQNATLTISAGVKFKYSTPQTKCLEINNGARLIARGTASTSPVIFSSGRENPKPGDWMSLWFKAGSFGELKNVEIEYAGFSWKEPLKIDNGAKVTKENIEIDPAKNLLKK